MTRYAHRDEALADIAETPLGKILLGDGPGRRGAFLDHALGNMARVEALEAAIEAGSNVHPVGDDAASTASCWVLWSEMPPFRPTDKVYRTAALLGMPILDFLAPYALLEEAGLAAVEDGGIRKLAPPLGMTPPGITPVPSPILN